MRQWKLSHRYEFQGQTVRYDLLGSGSPLVLVHGTPWSSFNWRHLIPRLAENWTVYFYDLLGYGQSEMREGQNVSLEVQTQVLAELLTHWQLDAPIIMGHDFGGTTVLRTHLLAERDFEQIVLVDPVALAPWGSSFFSYVKQHEAVFQGLPDYIHEAIVRAYVQGAMRHPMPETTLEGIVQPWLGESGRKAFYRQIAQASQRFTDEIEPRYSDISRPVLIVWGEEDQWIPIEKGRQLHQAISSSKFVSIPGAGHLVQEDAPELLFAVVQDFLL